MPHEPKWLGGLKEEAEVRVPGAMGILPGGTLFPQEALSYGVWKVNVVLSAWGRNRAVPTSR